ncbi:MAG: recombination-associated protein RdgC, partial [Gammaproteobacteria bacterium]|nr:recombination-associated protein RdgC [Gammaproteobacteria bacterium]
RHDPSSLGWTSPLGRGSERLAHEVSGCLMICARQEDKLLPAAVVNEILEEKQDVIEADEGRKVGRNERSELREEIIHQLMPQAFVRSSRTFAMIDRQQGWILVDASGSTKAEGVISLLRETLGSLPVRPFEVVMSPAAVLTDWLLRPTQHKDFVLMDSCELRDMDEEGGVIRCRGLDLTADEIQAHLKAGKQVVKLGVEWDERISVVIESDLALKRVRFLDVIQEQAADVQTEDEIAQFDVTFSLMSLEFRRMIPRLLELFGGFSVGQETQ